MQGQPTKDSEFLLLRSPKATEGCRRQDYVDGKTKGMPGASLGVAVPRGSTTGTQGLKNAKLRSMIPYTLGLEILKAITQN
jgi:hypothetical protein